MDYYRELYHHGIKGQKWGVRRYQNEDGSLTEAGRQRYSYGSVSVQHIKNRGEPDTVRLSNKEKTLEVSKKSFQDLERVSNLEVLGTISKAWNVSMKDASKMVNGDKDYKDVFNGLMDSYMDSQLSSLLNTYGSNKKSEPKVSKQRSNKPKYTQEQAIDKVYDDLEKKYPNFNKLSPDKQDQLFMDYASESGLIEYIFD